MEHLTVKIKKTSRSHKGKKVPYVGETIYPNGRHAVFVLLNPNGSHGTWGGTLSEFDLEEIDIESLTGQRSIKDRSA